jgi:hypothetical protein
MPSTENIYNPLPPNNNLNSSPYNASTDANEQKIYQKINELNKQINQSDIPSAPYNKQGQSVQARIALPHISIYMALLQQWNVNGGVPRYYSQGKYNEGC